jgi:iron complex outermembrane receptor protein
MRMINWSGDGNGYVGNLELKPEVANTLSATFDWHDGSEGKWGLKVSPYYTQVDDYIDARRCGPSDVVAGTTSTACTDANLTATDSFVYLKLVNQSARIYGVDISGHMPVAENTAFGNFKATGQLSYVRGTNEDTNDNLYNMMPLNAKLALVQQSNGWSNSAEVEIVTDKDDVSQVRNELKTVGYELLHLRSSYTWKDLRVDFGIENALDEFYNDPLGGAYLGEGKTMSGGDVPWGTAVPGMGRSFYLGMNYKF